MANKNIWVINQFAGTDKSGWGERHYFLSKYWTKMGYDVSIISGSYNHVFNNLPDAPNQYNFEDVDKTRFCWIKVPKYKGQSVKRFWSFFVFMIKVLFVPTSKLGKPDIIIISSMPIFPVFTAYLLKRIHKAETLIFEIRDIWPLTLIHLGDVSPNSLAVKLLGWFEKFGYKKADYIVSLLPNAKKHFEEVAKAGQKFVYIPNGLDHSVLSVESLDEEMEKRFPEDKFIIGYTGTIGLANALEYFVEAAGLLQEDPRFHFIIIGDGYLKEELKKSSAGFDNITFFKKIRKNQVLSAVRKFDVCFVGRNDSPLFKHGVSANKYFDYMLSGKPILDSNNHIKDPVELSGCGIIVEPESAEAIARGVIELYEAGEKALHEMGEKGRKYVEEHHKLKYLANKYTSLFEGENVNQLN